MSICPACEPMTATDWPMWRNRQRKIIAFPEVDIAPCLSCGRTDYMLDMRRLPAYPPHDGAKIPAIAVLVGCVIVIMVCTWIAWEAM